MVEELCLNARASFSSLSSIPTEKKNLVLQNIVDLLDENRQMIIDVNEKDMKRAKNEGKDRLVVNRLRFDNKKIDQRIESLLLIKSLPDPIGQYDEYTHTSNGLQIAKMRVPLGVILMIYEACPH